MATKVADGLYESITGRLFEIWRQLQQPNGYPFDPLELDRALQALIEGRFQSGSLAISAFDRDMTKEGWTLFEGFDEPDPHLLSKTKFELVPILEEGESTISGEEMRKRAAQEDANFGQRFGEWLLAYQEKIPERPKETYYIPLTRTVWRDRVGSLRVSYLRWSGRQWILNFRRLEECWGFYGRFLRPRK